jgi:hypothetical protein
MVTERPSNRITGFDLVCGLMSMALPPIARWRIHGLKILLTLLFLLLGFAVCGRANPDAERQRNAEQVSAIWPEADDPQSLMGKEIQRLRDHYQSRNDLRLKAANVPMWIASEAATNIERYRTVEEAEQTAMRLYPALRVLDSPLNKLFRQNYERLKAVEPTYFNDPRWPIELALKCATEMDLQRSVAAAETGGSPEIPSITPGLIEASGRTPVNGNWVSRFLSLVLVLVVAGGLVGTAAAIRRKHPFLREADFDSDRLNP